MIYGIALACILTMIGEPGSAVPHFALQRGDWWRRRPAGDSCLFIAAQNRRRDAGATNLLSLRKIR